MKKLKISMLAVLFTVSIGTAVVQKIHAAPKADDSTYNWDGNGPSHSGTDLNRTISQAKSDYGCTGTSVACAEGTPTSGVGDNVQIFQP